MPPIEENGKPPYEHMCGRGGGDPWYAPVALDGPPVAPPIRVSLVTGGPDTGADTDADVADALRQAAELLAEAGYLVEERPAPRLSRASEIRRSRSAPIGIRHGWRTGRPACG